jgi:hypothetical protein
MKGPIGCQCRGCKRDAGRKRIELRAVQAKLARVIAVERTLMMTVRRIDPLAGEQGGNEQQ